MVKSTIDERKGDEKVDARIDDVKPQSVRGLVRKRSTRNDVCYQVSVIFMIFMIFKKSLKDGWMTVDSSK